MKAEPGPENEFDLRLEWEADDESHLDPSEDPDPVEPRSGDPGDDPDRPRPGVLRGDRGELVLPVRDERPAFWAAVNAIDAQAVELGEEALDWADAEPGTAVELGDIPGALEEVREHLAAAFDVVRDLAAHLVPLAEQLGVLTTATEAVDGRVVQLSEGFDGRLARLEDGLDDIVGSLSAVVEAGQVSAASLTGAAEGRFSRLEQGMGELAGWIEARFASLEDALGNDLDDFSDEVGYLTDLVAATGSASDAALGGADETGVDLLDTLVAGQQELISQVRHLTEEVEAYRRRVQVYARPPTITDDQLDAIVLQVTAGVTAALQGEPRGSAPAVQPPDEAEPAHPTPAAETDPAADPAAPAEPAAPAAPKTKRRRRG